MDALAFATLAVTGFVACAEFGSYAFVHPVLRRLPATERIRVEQGLLKTFGRVMPVGMPLSLILAIAFATRATGASPWTWVAVAAFATATLTTLIVNVPVNLATGTWDPEHPPKDWQATRARWERFQGIRSWLLLAGFLLVCVANTAAAER